LLLEKGKVNRRMMEGWEGLEDCAVILGSDFDVQLSIQEEQTKEVLNSPRFLASGLARSLV
jgi:hypothetical protein